MLRSLILRKLGAEERRMGVSVDYLRHILGTSLGSFLVFTKILPISNHRKALPVDAYHVARLVATRDEDCGTCVQIEVNLAKADGVAVEILEAVTERRPDDLRADLATVYRFAEEVVTASYAEGELRERVRAAYGEKALVEMAMAIASARFFPVTKRALGYATSCSRVEVEV